VNSMKILTRFLFLSSRKCHLGLEVRFLHVFMALVEPIANFFLGFRFRSVVSLCATQYRECYKGEPKIFLQNACNFASNFCFNIHFLTT